MALTLSGTDGIVGAGFTLDASGASVTAGVGTFSSLQGSGANLTALPAANLTGTLPALNAASLTKIPAANIVGVCTDGFSGGKRTISSSTTLSSQAAVDYTGFGWTLIKKGVFEHDEMKYPWFAPKMQVFESGEVQDMCGEDVSFCLDAKEAGFEIWCDPRVRVGHEKQRVI